MSVLPDAVNHVVDEEDLADESDRSSSPDLPYPAEYRPDAHDSDFFDSDFLMEGFLESPVGDWTPLGDLVNEDSDASCVFVSDLPDPSGDTDDDSPDMEEVRNDASRKAVEKPKHAAIREKALEKTIASAAIIADQYGKCKRVKVRDFAVGDTITVTVPKLDRSGTDFPRLPCIVQEVHGDKRKTYTFGISFGVLLNKFSDRDLQDYSGEVEANTSRSISLREAAKLSRPENRFCRKRCSCKGKCSTKNCSCYASGLGCSSHCHPGLTCRNEPTPEKKTASSERPLLTGEDRARIERNEWLSDNHMRAASELLKLENHGISGLQDTALQQNSSFTPPTSEYV